MAEYTPPSLAGGLPSAIALNNAFIEIQSVLSGVISKQEASGNSMEVDLDMNGHDLLNVGGDGERVLTTKDIGTVVSSSGGLVELPNNVILEGDPRLSDTRVPSYHTHDLYTLNEEYFDYVTQNELSVISAKNRITALEDSTEDADAISTILDILYKNVRVDAVGNTNHFLVYEWFLDDLGVPQYRYDFDLIDEDFVGAIPSTYPDDADNLIYQLRHEGEEIFWHKGISGYLRANIHTVETIDSEGMLHRWDVIDEVPLALRDNHPSLGSMAPYYREVLYELASAPGDPSPTVSGPQITDPTPDSIITGTSATFNWVADGTPIQNWVLRIGTSLGTVGHHSGAVVDDLILTETVNTLPADGSTIFVRLGYKTMEGPWVFVDTTYVNNA